jgi:RND superfamily putative drug exporter
VARAVVRRRWAVVVGTTAALLAMSLPVLGLHLGSPTIEAYGRTDTAAAAASAVTDAGIPPGVFRPTEVLTTDPDALVADLARVPGVASASAVDDPAWTHGDTTLLQVYAADDPATGAGADTLSDVRSVADVHGARIGGTPAEDADFVTAVYADAPLVLGLVVLVTFLLLARALRSLWLPVKALLLNVVSLGAAYGLTVLIWQHGIGTEALFGSSSSGAVVTWVPVAAFAFLFGLSMDYEVFLLSRMRESWDLHGDTPRAVVDGVSQTARLVTSAALILFLSFVALSTVPSIDVKVLATTLALGIAIDALIVRTLLAPALVAVLGRANWTLPHPLRRALLLPREPLPDPTD